VVVGEHSPKEIDNAPLSIEVQLHPRDVGQAG
jgi:hypothetical protein